jgi:hypothetical protein
MPESLEDLFHQEMLNVYSNALWHCRYDARIFLPMVNDHGGLEAARRLLATSYLPDGFAELWMRGRLDLTMEALVVKEPWRRLFTDEEITVARQRLADPGGRQQGSLHRE